MPLALITVTAVTDEAQLLSPRKKLATPGVPVLPKRARGVVPEASAAALCPVSEEPDQLKEVPVMGPVTISDEPMVAAPVICALASKARPEVTRVPVPSAPGIVNPPRACTGRWSLI